MKDVYKRYYTRFLRPKVIGKIDTKIIVLVY